jgi:hypothetical protein
MTRAPLPCQFSLDESQRVAGAGLALLHLGARADLDLRGLCTGVALLGLDARVEGAQPGRCCSGFVGGVIALAKHTLSRTKDTDSLDTDLRDTDSADALPSPKRDFLEHGVLTLANGLCEYNRKKGCLEVLHEKKTARRIILPRLAGLIPQ